MITEEVVDVRQVVAAKMAIYDKQLVVLIDITTFTEQHVFGT